MHASSLSYLFSTLKFILCTSFFLSVFLVSVKLSSLSRDARKKAKVDSNVEVALQLHMIVYLLTTQL